MLKRETNSSDEIVLRYAKVGALYEMGEHFGVCFGAEIRVAVPNEFLFQRLIIFDHSIVHERKFAARVKMRMRVLVSDLAVRGPTRVANSQRT